jgi:hypothetical protein
MRGMSLNVRTLMKTCGAALLPLVCASIVYAAPAPRRAAGPICDPQTPAASRKLPRHPKSYGGPLADRLSSRMLLTDLRARMVRGMRADLTSDEAVIQNDAPVAQMDGDDRPIPALRPLGLLIGPRDVRPDSEATSPRSPRGPPLFV